jgi:5-formyltetrahydrofolate cyclo-ligase
MDEGTPGISRRLAEAARAKQAVRERVWALLERERVVRFPGAQVGKGGGFSDLEFALLAEAGLIGRDTVVATTVHPLQVLDEALPETDHDFRLDLIVAGEEITTCRRIRRPPGILWEHLDAAKVAAVPALAARAPDRANRQG